jgi:hypothetical protein
MHESGEWFENTLTAKSDWPNPPAVGSAITYLRRYALQSLSGLAADDDDGAGATGRPGRQEPPKQIEPKKPSKPAPVADPPELAEILANMRTREGVVAELNKLKADLIETRGTEGEALFAMTLQTNGFTRPEDCPSTKPARQAARQLFAELKGAA